MDVKEESMKADNGEKKITAEEKEEPVEKIEDCKIDKSDDKGTLETCSESPIRLTLVEEEEVCFLHVCFKKVYKMYFFCSWSLQKVIKAQQTLRRTVCFFKFCTPYLVNCHSPFLLLK